MLELLASTVGALVVLLSLWVLVSPAALQRRLPELFSGSSLYGLALARLLIGCLLLAVAAESRHPAVLASLGWLTVLAGLLLIAIPPSVISRIAVWYAGLTPMTLRLMLPFSMAFGAYIIYALNP
jgi:hypothetical protein